MDTYYDDTTFVFEENEDPCCNGCMKPIEDGSVVQFGDGIWHFECLHPFHCFFSLAFPFLKEKRKGKTKVYVFFYFSLFSLFYI
ncbi:hypothetical protein BDA99DRAFT_272016 [Phascolomyces articulosus]|uniref:LIM zinc-binding domain-containing protein n=1 Tax=Phascolomyces articulosus TaxID=60185 RepID=A0AAD5JXW5_9FUNG|nr:hypothetical protein BDA99DRAFT_272016 [Phascolomyces articulosus]